jgi:dolichol-phosphate mannosyltransferase
MQDAILLPSQTAVTPRRWTALVPAWGWALTAIFIVQVTVAALFPVLPEEAYHWNFARHLDWSYYDHPPMLPWSIALGRSLLGDTALGIRLVPLLFALGTSLLLARLAQRLYGERAALWAVLLHALQPAVFFVGGGAFPDAPELFFWTLSLTCVWQALKSCRAGWWLVAGMALGAAMLSKYTAAFLVPSVLLYLLFSKRDRHWLITPWPYLAGVCSLLVFAPVICWNWAHDWVSFRMQSTARFEAADGIELGCGLQSMVEQWVFVLPLTLPLAAVVVRRLARLAQPRDQFLFWSFAPMASFFFLIGWTPSWHVLWSLPAYLALTVAMAGAMAGLPDAVARFYRARWPYMVVPQSCGVVVILLHSVFVLPGVPPLRETYGWGEAAALARTLATSLPPGAFYMTAFGRPYPAASQLAFHLKAPLDVFGQNLVGQPALQYRFWADPEQLAGKDAVIVVEGGDPNDLGRIELMAYFQTVEPAIYLTVPAGEFGSWSRSSTTFALYLAHDYRPAR